MSEPATQCRGNGGGGGEGGAGGMRTVECLRGRLLAERVASKAAKEEADQLAARLDELEKRLSNEVKIRDRAERRLRRAIRRLESLKILDVGSSIGSLSSNSNACSGQQAAPEMDGPASSLSTVDSVRSGPREDKGWDGESVKGSSAGSCTQANSSQDGSWFSVVSEQSGSGVCKEEESRAEDSDDAEKCGSGDSAGDVDRDSESRREEQPGASSGSSKSEASYRDEDDDRLALVLVDNPHYSAEPAETKEKEDEKEGNDELAVVLAGPQPRATSDVQSVLLALRQVKEQLRYTIQRRSEGLVAHRELYGH
ncbi:hypothetical protein CFC21_062039 [Triticum aestivum]|uniref:Uncharacterized protein n=2 Tax=Triticum aestivum TaxID=4565 RepID=A0A3B6JJE9_WHEAT|nr:uncharacterized protein LOC123097833 isoform X1 [Triticum aestivum]KAF7054350.1 hypothetical protein CFC21_062039 [Triticum aestivum]